MIKYGDKVIIVEGFYEGCRGVVVDYSRIPAGTTFYNIEIKTHIGTHVREKTIEVQAKEMKIIR